MDHGTQGDVSDGQAVAGLNVGALAGLDVIANLQAVGGQDVALLAVLILHQSNESGAVGIVFDGLDFGGHANLVTLEIDDTVLNLVTAAMMTDGDTAIAVAASGLLQRLQQALLRLDLAQTTIIDNRHVTTGGSRGLKALDRHYVFTP